MPGFNSNSNFRNNVKERFTSYDQLYAKLVELGSSSKRAFPLYTIGSDGNDANIIGHWGYNSTGAIVPYGEIDFTKVTDGGFAIVASTGSVPGTLNLTAGHTLPSSFNSLLWDISGSSGSPAELFYNQPAIVNGNQFTGSDVTGMTAGDIVYGVGRSEFSIGGATRNIRPQLNAVCKFSGSAGQYISGGKVVQAYGKAYNKGSSLVANIKSYTPLSATEKCIIVGWHVSNILHTGYGFSRDAGALIRPTREQNAVLTANATWSVVGSPVFIWMSSQFYVATQTAFLGGTSVENGGPHFNCIITNSEYLSSFPYLCADDGAVFSSIIIS